MCGLSARFSRCRFARSLCVMPTWNGSCSVPAMPVLGLGWMGARWVGVVVMEMVVVVVLVEFVVASQRLNPPLHN